METRYFVELSDVIGVEFCCPRCNLTFIKPVKLPFAIPEKCPTPHCPQEWWPVSADSADSAYITYLRNFVGHLLSLGQSMETNLGAVKLRLEVNEPDFALCCLQKGAASVATPEPRGK